MRKMLLLLTFTLLLLISGTNFCKQIMKNISLKLTYVVDSTLQNDVNVPSLSKHGNR